MIELSKYLNDQIGKQIRWIHFNNCKNVRHNDFIQEYSGPILLATEFESKVISENESEYSYSTIPIHCKYDRELEFVLFTDQKDYFEREETRMSLPPEFNSFHIKPLPFKIEEIRIYDKVESYKEFKTYTPNNIIGNAIIIKSSSNTYILIEAKMGDDQNEPCMYFKIMEESTIENAENYFDEHGWHHKYGEYQTNMNLKENYR